MGPRAGAAGLALLAALWAPRAAPAELYRCVGPDGSVRFTDAAGACGASSVHEPTGAVQRVPAAPASPSRSEAALRTEAEAEAERSWRERRRQGQLERSALAQERQRLEAYALWCNRGGALYRKDEAGLKVEVECGQVHRDLETVAERIAALDAWLEEGLAEECRRAGCLPGWVR